MTDYENVIQYINLHFEHKNIEQLAYELRYLVVNRHIKEEKIYAFYIMHKAIKEFENMPNHCLRVAVAVYAFMYNSSKNVFLHIGYLLVENQIVPHSWVTIGNIIIDIRHEEHIDMLII